MTQEQDNAIQDQIQDALDNLTSKLDGFKPREGQEMMISEVAKTLQGEYGGKPIIVAEGPTGTGKTLAYLLSVIPVAKALGKKVVISSATVALQEQLIERDIPNMQKYSGIEFNYAVAKGRGRYACRNNLDMLTGNHPDQGQLFEGEDLGVWKYQPEEDEIKHLYQMYEDLGSNRWDGCRDTLPKQVSDDLWGQIGTDGQSCMGRVCRNYRQCPFVRARWELGDVDVIVANHDLVLSYLQLGTDNVLPAPEDAIYVFDEAHHLPRKAIGHFAAKVSLRGMKDLGDKLGKLLPRIVAVAPDGLVSDEQYERAEELIREVTAQAGDYRNLVRDLPFGQPVNGRSMYRAPLGQIPEPMRVKAEEIQQVSRGLFRVIASLREKLNDALEEKTISPQMAENVMPEIGMLQGKAEQATRLWTLMAEEDDQSKPPRARWVIQTERDFIIEASPISAADTLRRKLWQACAGAVVTSATLRSVGTFDRIRAKMGLGKADGTQYCALPSPFDYQNNGLLYVPWMQSDGSRPDAHTAEITAMMPGLLQDNASALVLFSSWRQMREVQAGLPANLKKKLLVQGEISKPALIEKHIKRVRQGKQSYIFGVDSMAEGVDLPGELCEHVIIAKLPFAMPDSPIEATQSEWLEQTGRHPFMQLAVPEASLKLIQAVGRLLRTENDKGQVTILDRRIVTKRYGGLLMNSLPPFRRHIEDQQSRRVANA